jgi:REP element-mobilizing transposase RayT
MINEHSSREGEPRFVEQSEQRLGRSLALPCGGSVAVPSLVELPAGCRLLPSRRHPAHGIKCVDGQPTIIFDTLCTKDRAAVLACDEFHCVFRNVAADATAWTMGRYVIMPDHIHFFAGDVGSNTSYEKWVKYLKSQITKRYLGGRGSRRAVAEENIETARREPRPPVPQERRSPLPFRWLTDHWDRRVRSAESYEEKWQYFLNNPVRAGLVTKPEDWPFQRELFEIRWE